MDDQNKTPEGGEGVQESFDNTVHDGDLPPYPPDDKK
jgi:hypothetical protein